MMNLFRTALTAPTNVPFQIQYAHRILLLGSCFVEHIGQRLQDLKYQVAINPFGTTYNPIALANSIHILLSNKTYTKEDIFWANGHWNTWQHHSRFSNTDSVLGLTYINQTLTTTRALLNKIDRVVLTLGTSWVYELIENHQVVNNCHKQPDALFQRKKLSVTQIVEALATAIIALQQQSPNVQIILTVSPIRHIKDGLVENQLSKASLLVAAHTLCEQYDFVHYFPAYEMMMDDLRDYRFYAADMLHPSEVAIDYIWEYLENNYLDKTEKTIRQQLDKLLKATQHRVFNTQTEEYKKFAQQQLDKIKHLEKQVPYLDFNKEKAHFGEY